jgi:hypothetical protein
VSPDPWSSGRSGATLARVDVRFLACKDVCIPGRLALSA